MYSRRGNRYSSGNSERYPTQQSPLLAYLNYLWEVSDNELCTVLQKNMEKSLQLLRDILSSDEIINIIYLLLRVSKLDVDFKIKANLISVILTEISRQLSVFIIYIPFVRNSEYQESLERFWLALLELIQELIKLNNPLHKQHVINIYLDCKEVVSYKKNAETFNIPEIPVSINNDIKMYLDVDEIESINFYLSHGEVEKFHSEETTIFKSLKEFKSFDEYFKWQYLEIRREFISTLSKAIKQLHENFNSDNVNDDFQIMLNCTGMLNRNGILTVTTGDCKQKYFENEEYIQGCLVCFSDNSYQTYTFGIITKALSENTLLVDLININPCLLSKTFSMALYKREFYRATDCILQSVKRDLFKDLPFKEYILFGRNYCIKQPKYLQEASEYNIDDFKFKPYDFNTWPAKEYFQLSTEQYLALQHIVTNELALIMGYPGSGKTNVVLKFINLLLKNKQIWQQHDSGPILILAFTNKSLDNFMEKVLPLTDSVVRIGGQTTSEKLKKLSEKKVSRIALEIRNKIKSIGCEINKVVREVQAVLKNGGLINVEYLEISKISNQSFYDKLMGNSEIEIIALKNEILDVEENPLTDVNPVRSHVYYVTVSDLQARHDKNSSYLQWRLTHKEAHKKFYPQNGVNYNNIQNVSGNNLWGLYFHLVDQYVNKLKEKINRMLEQRRILRDNLSEQENVDNSKILKQKMIVGFTFSGAALRKSMIDTLSPSIVIIEESSYIEHYNVLGTIPKSCQHLILIGDTCPAITVPEINNCSLVDILSEYKYPVAQLKKQFRMKSEIAFLLRTLFYPDMVDDESVAKISNVPGIPKPVYFINHCVEDDDNENMNWKRAINLYEIEYLVQLIKFLLFNDVSAESITILTTTKYQALEFDKVKENDKALQKIKSWSIDKFQSLENDIILLSLVGINEHYRSFLTKENRLRTALSRSKQGFYLIGNMEKLCKQYDIWASIRELLEEKGYIGNDLPISCPLHIGKECAFIEKPEDFLNVESHFITCCLENLTINN